MAELFNADEIFQIGLEIEKNGREFYLAAMSRSKEREGKELFKELADWESRHMKLFEELRAQLPTKAKEENIYDPENEIVLYLKAAADDHVFIKNPNLNSLIDKCSSAADILKLAIGFEKDSIVYYAAMKQLVRADQGKNDLDKLIAEELNHVSLLTREAKRLTEL